jgi:hypothetical protein
MYVFTLLLCMCPHAALCVRIQVPLEAYEHMEREALLLRTELRDKEVALQVRWPYATVFAALSY